MPRSERHMVHRILPEAAIGVEDVPLDEEGFLFGLGETLEFGERGLHPPVKLCWLEKMEWCFAFGLHGG